MSDLTVTLAPPEESALLSAAQKRADIAGALVIASAASYTQASEELALIKGKAKELDEMRKAITKPLDEAKAKVMDLFRRPLAMLESAEKALKRGMIEYREAEELKRLEAQRKLEEAARKERERLQAEAAAAEAKARQQAEELRKKAEEAAAAGKMAEAARLNSRAESAEDKGIEKAAELQTISELVVAPQVQAEVPKVAGQSVRKIWKGRITNRAAFIVAVAARPEYHNLLEINQSALDKLAKALEENFRLEGAEAYTETSMGARAA